MGPFSNFKRELVLMGVLKQYLRTLPEPLFKFPLEERVKHTEDLGEVVI